MLSAFARTLYADNADGGGIRESYYEEGEENDEDDDLENQ